jgi:hypothetical protein
VQRAQHLRVGEPQIFRGLVPLISKGHDAGVDSTHL